MNIVKSLYNIYLDDLENKFLKLDIVERAYWVRHHQWFEFGDLYPCALIQTQDLNTGLWREQKVLARETKIEKVERKLGLLKWYGVELVFSETDEEWRRRINIEARYFQNSFKARTRVIVLDIYKDVVWDNGWV